MKITPVRADLPLTDGDGHPTAQWGLLLQSFFSNASGEWELQQSKRNPLKIQLCGPVLHISARWSSGVTDPGPFTLPVSCYDAILEASDDNIVLTTRPIISGNVLTIPAGTYTDLLISGTAIIKREEI